MKLMFLGAPGAGKGTQAEVISERYQIPAISTGALLREAMAKGTELGKKAKSSIDGGALAPDDVVIGIIKERLGADDCKNTAYLPSGRYAILKNIRLKES